MRIDSDFPERLVAAVKAKHGRIELWHGPLIEVARAAAAYLDVLTDEAQKPSKARRRFWLPQQRVLTAQRLADACRRLGIEPAAPAGGCCGNLEAVNAELQAVADETQH